tara:strand:- start:1661 stop:3460 length:1800 start_codon:yes stop_codon:yes gene_type:complete
MKYYVILLLLPSVLWSQNNISQRINNSPYPFSSPIDSLIVIYDEDFSEEELFTIEILQGQLAKHKPSIYRDIGTGSSVWINDLEENYNIVTDYNYSGNFLSILSKFKSSIDGYILYDSTSVNKAISLCAVLNAIPIKEEQLDYMNNLDIIFLDDARNYTFERILKEYSDDLSERIIIYQNPHKKLFLADYSVFTNSINFFDTLRSDLTTSFFSRMNPNSILLGASEDDEYQTIKKATENLIITQMADYAVNLSTLTNVNTEISQNYHELNFNEFDNAHTVCFVITDGDNIQWLLNWFYTDNRWFGNDKRGKIDIGWTISPALSELAPTVMQKIYKESANTNEGRDYFIAAPSGLGYIFPEKYSELNSYCHLLNDFMIKSDLNIVNIIGNDESNLNLYPYLIQDAIKGIFYYDYSNYSKLNGQITFYNNKPIICARYNLWGGFESPSSIIEKINNLPKDPYSEDGYSLIPVHNWSYSVDTLIQIVQGFDENINVVAPDEFLNLITSKLSDRNENIVQLSNYPNPTNNHITLEFLGNSQEIKTIEIYNIQGQNINMPYTIKPINNYLTKIIFNLDRIESGTYFISLTNYNDTKGITTVIKQ